MSFDTTKHPKCQRLRTLQIIAAALILGIATLGILVCAITDWNTVHSRLTLEVWMGLAAAAFALPASIIAPRWITPPSNPSNAPATSGERSAFATFHSRKIVQLAILEGSAFMNLLVFLVVHGVIALIVTGLVLLFMLALFPRESQLPASTTRR